MSNSWLPKLIFFSFSTLSAQGVPPAQRKRPRGRYLRTLESPGESSAPSFSHSVGSGAESVTTYARHLDFGLPRRVGEGRGRKD